MTSRTLLVDADIFAYIAASATEKVFHFDGPDSEPAIADHLEQGLEVAEREIETVANKLRATKVIVCLTDDSNFRTSVFPAYKANRANVRRPSTLIPIKAWFKGRYETYQRPGLEADDCMGILSTHESLVPGERIIVSGDKDMQTIPGLLFNPKKDKAPRLISELEADRYFMQQALTGDTTDGYPGCRGIGPKSSFVAALADAPDLRAMWEIVVSGYRSKGATPADALCQARCARILRSSDWDFQKRQPRLWTPPPS